MTLFPVLGVQESMGGKHFTHERFFNTVLKRWQLAHSDTVKGYAPGINNCTRLAEHGRGQRNRKETLFPFVKVLTFFSAA